MKFRNNRGITLIALIITIIILMIITGAIIYNSKNSILMENLSHLYEDIEVLSSKIDAYYLEHEELPVLCKYLSKQELKEFLEFRAGKNGKELFGELEQNDGDDNYYVIDLEKLDGLHLNYGYNDQYKNVKNNAVINEEDEIYIINEVTHQIYYPHGIFVDDYMYFRNNDSVFKEEIDEVLPQIDDISEIVTPKLDGFYLNISFEDSLKKPVSILIKKDNSDKPEGNEEEWENIENDVFSKKIATNYSGVENAIYYVWVKDDTKNISKKKEIKTEELHWLIVSADTNIEDYSKNITNGRYYSNLEKSIKAAQNGEKIILLDGVDIALSSGEVYKDNSIVDVNKNIIIDLNGKELIRNETINIGQTGALIIQGNGKIINNSTNIVYNRGKLTIKSGVDNSKVVVVPEKFSIPSDSTFDVNKGVVVEHESSEFVWVPVDKNTLCSDGISGKRMAKLQSNGTDYEGVLYSFSGTTSSEKTDGGVTTNLFREPVDLGDANDNVQKQYNDMIKSVKKYGGFYIGRYELSYDSGTDNVKSAKGALPASAADSATSEWSGLYNAGKLYSEKAGLTSVQSSMVWGSQYDAMLNWILNGTDKNMINQSNGNHSGMVATTGEYEDDKLNNIYDLGGNIREWTLEAYKTSRVRRGGIFNGNGSAIFRSTQVSLDFDNSTYGSRLSLYIK